MLSRWTDAIIEGESSDIGKEFTSIWLDTSNDTFKSLNVKGHSVIKLSPKRKKIKQSKDFGNKLEDFMKAIEPLKK